MAQHSVLTNLLGELGKLPGVGPKSAERLAYHLLNVPAAEALALADAIRRLREMLRKCGRCHNISEAELCEICADESRDSRQLCVVEQPKDLRAIEASGAYCGLYHVLGGRYSPLSGSAAEALTTDDLIRRVTKEAVEEVIIATNPDFEGDGTALLVAEALANARDPQSLRVSRLARGVPAGSQIEYMNRSIISDAIEGRRRVSPGDEEAVT